MICAGSGRERVSYRLADATCHCNPSSPMENWQGCVNRGASELLDEQRHAVISPPDTISGVLSPPRSTHGVNKLVWLYLQAPGESYYR